MNYSKQTQSNPTLSAVLSSEALAKTEASGEAGSNPIFYQKSGKSARLMRTRPVYPEFIEGILPVLPDLRSFMRRRELRRSVEGKTTLRDGFGK